MSKEVIKLIFSLISFNYLYLFYNVNSIGLDNYYPIIGLTIITSLIFLYSIKKVLISIVFGMILNALINSIITVNYYSLIIQSPEKVNNIMILIFLSSFNLFLYFYFKREERVVNERKITLEDIHNLGNNGRDFEDFVAMLFDNGKDTSLTTMQLKEMNNLPVSIMKRSGNGEQGVDVVVLFKKEKKIDKQIYDGLLIQAKHFSNKVGNSAVQEIVGGLNMYSEHFKKTFKPVVITNNTYTPHAKDLAQSNGVILIEGKDLLEVNVDNIQYKDCSFN